MTLDDVAAAASRIKSSLYAARAANLRDPQAVRAIGRAEEVVNELEWEVELDRMAGERMIHRTDAGEAWT